MSNEMKLPPGQYELNQFPRFGVPRFANRFPKETRQVFLEIKGDVGQPITISDELFKLPRVEQTSDFHCVTTWTRRSLKWSGFRFSDFYERIVVPGARPQQDASFVILRGQDGYGTSLPLADLLADSVLLADRLNGEPLPVEHGAPLRLLAPAHYAHKSAKHLCAIEFWRDDRHYRSPSPFRFMTHPRGRVAFEERGTGVPGWLLRYLYRPMVRPAIWLFQRAMTRHMTTKADN
jgi:DMSO/TMAO reductase YedYZ molybdopterin-dependent catalytic subunit